MSQLQLYFSWYCILLDIVFNIHIQLVSENDQLYILIFLFVVWEMSVYCGFFKELVISEVRVESFLLGENTAYLREHRREKLAKCIPWDNTCPQKVHPGGRHITVLPRYGSATHLLCSVTSTIYGIYNSSLSCNTCKVYLIPF